MASNSDEPTVASLVSLKRSRLLARAKLTAVSASDELARSWLIRGFDHRHRHRGTPLGMEEKIQNELVRFKVSRSIHSQS